MIASSPSRQRSKARNFRQNHGRPGVIYILSNPGLRSGIWKIGCSTRSGSVRAIELNSGAGTGTPGTFECIWEHETSNCGQAEELVFLKLAEYRRGKWGQEFFEVELAVAKQVIIETCAEIDPPHATKTIDKPHTTKRQVPPARRLTATKALTQVCEKCGHPFSVTLTRYDRGSSCPTCYSFNQVPDGWIDA